MNTNQSLRQSPDTTYYTVLGGFNARIVQLKVGNFLKWTSFYSLIQEAEVMQSCTDFRAWISTGKGILEVLWGWKSGNQLSAYQKKPLEFTDVLQSKSVRKESVVLGFRAGIVHPAGTSKFSFNSSYFLQIEATFPPVRIANKVYLLFSIFCDLVENAPSDFSWN